MTQRTTIQLTDQQRARVVETFRLPLVVVESIHAPEVFLVDRERSLILSMGPLEFAPTRDQYQRAVKVARMCADAVNEKYTGVGGYEEGHAEVRTMPWGRRDEVWAAKAAAEAAKRGEGLLEVRF